MTRFEWDQLEKQRGTFFKFYRWAGGDGSLDQIQQQHLCCSCKVLA